MTRLGTLAAAALLGLRPVPIRVASREEMVRRYGVPEAPPDLAHIRPSPPAGPARPHQGKRERERRMRQMAKRRTQTEPSENPLGFPEG